MEKLNESRAGSEESEAQDGIRLRHFSRVAIGYVFAKNIPDIVRYIRTSRT